MPGNTGLDGVGKWLDIVKITMLLAHVVNMDMKSSHLNLKRFKNIQI